MIGEHPELPPSLVRELHRDTRSRLYDWAWQQIANSVVPLFEGYKRLN